jgi:hypothetical protein
VVVLLVVSAGTLTGGIAGAVVAVPITAVTYRVTRVLASKPVDAPVLGDAATGYGTGMRDNDYPRPVSDPEEQGIPETADADSTAYDDLDSARAASGPDPAALPADEPVAVNDYGTTAAEQRRGEPLDARLAREEPDTAPAYPADQLEDADQDAVAPHPDSGVSSFERIGADPETQGQVGRLVEPDEGAHPDTEADAVASDAGVAGGGPSAEERAMHEERP